MSSSDLWRRAQRLGVVPPEETLGKCDYCDRKASTTVFSESQLKYVPVCKTHKNQLSTSARRRKLAANLMTQRLHRFLSVQGS